VLTLQWEPVVCTLCCLRRELVCPTTNLASCGGELACTKVLANPGDGFLWISKESPRSP
jgi:hypothetical protein